MSKFITKVNGTRTAKPKVNGSAPAEPITNNYDQLLHTLKKLSPDWQVTRVGIEAEIYRNQWELRAFSRNLFRENPYITAYAQDLVGQVIGRKGYNLRMRIKEQEDRVIHTPEERNALRAEFNRRSRISDFVSRQTGKKVKARRLFRETKGIAKVEVGDLDLFANQLIERKWKEWQLKENCTVTGRLCYNETRNLRLKSCARDGNISSASCAMGNTSSG